MPRRGLIRGRGLLLAGVAGLLPVALALAWCAPHRGPRFESVRQLKSWAEARGLYCSSDRQDGQVGSGLAVSTRALAWEQVGGLCRARAGKGDGWEGVVWAINRDKSVDNLVGAPWGGECRAWGGILVTGDPRLLDRLEGQGK